MRFPEGTPVRVEMTKWGGRPHWRFAGLYLGVDQHGEWVGFPRGTLNSRPGYAFDSEVDSVSLLVEGLGAVPTFHAPGIWCDTYVDVATPPTWDGDVVRAVDLDLDVIRMSSGTPTADPPPGRLAGPGEVFVDDEDEFEEHRVALGYPAEVVAGARAACAAVLAAVRAGTPPYDDHTAARWLARLNPLTR